MNKFNLFKAAHQLAKKIRQPGDDYRITFGACLRELATEAKASQMTVVGRKVADVAAMTNAVMAQYEAAKKAVSSKWIGFVDTNEGGDGFNPLERELAAQRSKYFNLLDSLSRERREIERRDEWTKAKTIARREAWNAAVKGLNKSKIHGGDIVKLRKRLGYDHTHIQQAMAFWGIK